jgi:hypothetical protein
VLAQTLHLEGNDAKARFVDFGENSTNVPVRYGVGLDHGKGPVCGHGLHFFSGHKSTKLLPCLN